MAGALTDLTWVALGSAVGAPLRFFVSGLVGRSVGETFPWGTLVVNVSGAFLIGLAAAWLRDASSAWLFAVTGILGGYTTVSSFALQTLALARGAELLRAGANAALSVGLCLAGAACGLGLAQAFGR